MTSAASPGRRVIVIGGGPAGLTAALDLCRRGEVPLVVEQAASLGGLARTETFQGHRFDLGGHRFFTRSDEVRRLWSQALGDDLVPRPRRSRIYYRQSYFHYPLRVLETLTRLGAIEAARIAASWVRARLWPSAEEETFEQWVTNRFGARLYRHFFQPYTEKVWGVSCRELRAAWAAQRIREVSPATLLRAALGNPRPNVRSLIEEFDYPRLGPGMMWEAFGRQIEALGGRVLRGAEVVGLSREGQRVTGVRVRTPEGEQCWPTTDVISTMPLPALVARLEPRAPADVLASARQLRHRDFLTVGLVVRQPNLFPDNWIYVHDPGLRVARIQNYRNWSPDMAGSPAATPIGMEYFCNEGDELWQRSDVDLVALATRELTALGLASGAEVETGCVFRVPKAYPLYDATYAQHLRTVREYVGRLANCQTVGRNGLHRYNNMDHSMLTGLMAARNVLCRAGLDVWAVNDDDHYAEEIPATATPTPHGRS